MARSDGDAARVALQRHGSAHSYGMPAAQGGGLQNGIRYMCAAGGATHAGYNMRRHALPAASPEKARQELSAEAAREAAELLQRRRRKVPAL